MTAFLRPDGFVHIGCSVLLVVLGAGCSGDDLEPATLPAAVGGMGQGGAVAVGGTAAVTSGGAAAGGTTAQGGAPTGGTTASGAGGAAAGGVAAGGAVAGGGTAGSAGTAGVAGAAGTTCVAPQIDCGGSCIDPMTDSANCGACNAPCTGEMTCVAGQCACAMGTQACGMSCVDVQTDASNCGMCGMACTGGRTCVGGACACPMNQLSCGDACVDPMTDAAHCGGCDQACDQGLTCAAGSCACGGALTLCVDTCVDTMTDAAHCGDCDTACPLGQSCAGGACGGGSADDGCSGLAQGITVSDIKVYQTVEIPIMEGGEEIPGPERNSDLVAGRDAVVRVFVTVGAGWTARELSARLILETADGAVTLFTKKTVSGNSSGSALDSTFQIEVPKEAMTDDAEYAVELVECATPSGSGGAPRFPASETVPLGARTLGILKVHVVPLQCNNRTPDTSESALAVYEDLFLAMYPITGVEWSVGDSVSVGYPVDWSGTLDRVRSERQSDGPPADVYYYGFIKPADTLRDYCGGGCTAGIGYVPGGSGNQQASARAAMGLAFTDDTSAVTMTHEVGHNHGRNHAPCVQGGSISGVDPNYPYNGGAIGVIGYDYRDQQFIQANQATDVMGYCNDKWISDYTYDGILNRLAQVNGVQDTYVPPELIGTWQVLLIDPNRIRWGIPIDEPTAAAGDPEPAEILNASGQVIKTVTVYRTEISDIGAFSVQVPTPEAGWYSVRVKGAAAIAFLTGSTP